eukprot:scaffold62451_cov28-Tisochrysis_lutea.AAC.4
MQLSSTPASLLTMVSLTSVSLPSRLLRAGSPCEDTSPSDETTICTQSDVDKGGEMRMWSVVTGSISFRLEREEGGSARGSLALTPTLGTVVAASPNSELFCVALSESWHIARLASSLLALSPPENGMQDPSPREMPPQPSRSLPPPYRANRLSYILAHTSRDERPSHYRHRHLKGSSSNQYPILLDRLSNRLYVLQPPWLRALT